MVFNTGAALLDAIVLAVVSKDAEGTYGYKITQEVREVIEAAVITNLRDGSLRVHQHAGGVTDTDIGDIVGEGLPGPQLEETAESGRGHTYEFRQLV